MANENDGGYDREWSKFANGETAKRRPCVYNPDGEKVQPDYSDKWALKTFMADPYNPPVERSQSARGGNLPPEIYAKHK
jgi:hypothetical protein